VSYLGFFKGGGYMYWKIFFLPEAVFVLSLSPITTFLKNVAVNIIITYTN
jgi:hypothetical protein